MTEKILLDTDIGTDVDDALALAYLLAHPECELLGITTVTGEPEKRARLASVLCTLAGKDIPIYPGAANPLIVPQQQTRAQQAAILSGWPHRRRFPRNAALEFQRRVIRDHPGQVTLLTIAPLTNIGLLFAADPEIPGLLKGLVLMCGYYFGRRPGTPPREWNALGDPHATRIVFSHKPPNLRAVGLDVTSQVTMPAAEFRTAFGRGRTRILVELAEVWFREYPQVTFHDPLAAAAIFRPEVCGLVPGTVTIDISDSDRAGATAFRRGGTGAPHAVAGTVDRECFLDEFQSVLARF